MLLLAVAVGCSSSDERTAAGDGRVIVEDHREPDGRVVRAGLGDVTYDTHFDGEQEGRGLVIEVDDDEGGGSIVFPLPPIDEDLQMLGAFGGGDVGHVSVFAAPDGTVLEVRYRAGDEYALDVGSDGLAVVVAPTVGALDHVDATAPDGRRCRLVGAPSSGRDCQPI